MKKIILIGFILGCLSGCASIVSKTEYDVAITSNPGQANFTIVNKKGEQVFSGVTPATATLKSSAGYFQGQSYTVKFTKEGYADQTFTLKSTVDGWYIGNIVFGGLLGLLVIDPATGAMYNLPKNISVTLDESVSQNQIHDITIASIENLTSAQRAQLVKIN